MVAGLANVTLVLGPAARAGADGPCVDVRAPAGTPVAWSEALADLKSEIARLPAADCQPMTLSLEPQREGMRIVALTRDGRRAERTVRRPEGLAAMALGLIMTIPAEPTAAPDPPGGPPSGPVPAPVPPSPEVRVAPAPTQTASSPTSLGLWAGFSAGIRSMAPPSLSAFDVEARADLIFGRWLMPIALRSALVSCLGQQGLDCDAYRDVSLGAGVGRRFHADGPDIDVAIEPSLVVMHMEHDGVPDEGQSVEDTEVVLRIDGSARLAVPVDAHWRLTVTLDAGLAPSLAVRPVRLERPAGTPTGTQSPPSFPAWCGGLRLGLSGALL